MKLGIPLFRLRPEQMAPVTRRAEELGFESAWVPEHLVLPVTFGSRYPYSADGVPPIRPDSPLLDPLIALAHIAASTSRIRLGTNVYLPALRHPLVVARMVTTLDVFSGGRMTLGVGAGWLAEEFEAVGVDFATRGARTRECVRALRELWTAPEPEFHGRFFDFGPVRFEPKPVQKPHPPIVFGGETPAALRRAAALGEGWYGVGHTPETAAPRVRELRELLQECGRSAPRFEITVSHAGPTIDVGTIERYRAAGVDRVVVLPWIRGREAEANLTALAETLRLEP